MKWIGGTAVLIILFKCLAYWERGYHACGEEIIAVGFMIALYWVLHSEPFIKWKQLRRNKRRLKRLAERAS